MHYIIFGAIALVFLIVAYLIGIKRQLNLICTLEENTICKIKDKKTIAKRFSMYYLFTGIVSMLCPLFINFYGDLGIVISVVTLLFLFTISIAISIIYYKYLKDK